MRGRQELDASHRRHEEERLAGASPSPTPAIREHVGQRRGRAVSPSPSSPFSRQNKLNGFPDIKLNGFPDNLHGGESWIGIPAIIPWLSSGAFLSSELAPFGIMLWDNIGQLLPGFPWHILVLLGIFFGVLVVRCSPGGGSDDAAGSIDMPP
ncbi:hypothetical protein E4U32_002869, partial [Claviceps aff. humidiphila group G2b]